MARSDLSQRGVNAGDLSQRGVNAGDPSKRGVNACDPSRRGVNACDPSQPGVNASDPIYFLDAKKKQQSSFSGEGNARHFFLELFWRTYIEPANAFIFLENKNTFTEKGDARIFVEARLEDMQLQFKKKT